MLAVAPTARDACMIAFLSGLGGGCAVPVAAFAETMIEGHMAGVRLTGLVISVDGQKAIKVTGESTHALRLGEELAHKAISQGAGEILSLNRSEVK